jgi:hypothetical protein
MLSFLTVAMMLAVAYAYFREGIFTAAAMFINTFLAGIIAFNFWEPLARTFDEWCTGTFLHGYEDTFCLLSIFCITLGVLRLLTNMLCSTVIDFPLLWHQLGGIFFGLAKGYIAAGFFICTLQTLPWHENFLGFDPKFDATTQGVRRLIPPDRVWLALMYRAGAFAFATSSEDKRYANVSGSVFERAYNLHFTFDKFATFEMRYARFRRYGDTRDPERYQGQLTEELFGPSNN